jgi:phage regulator Rha-like protein
MENEFAIKNIESRIFNIRGLQVMMDSDLAAFYGTETKYINRAVQRNMERFPDSFCFQLTMQEWADLRFQFGTLEIAMKRGGHRKYLPMVFTEQGVAMLSAVLKSKTAVAVSIAIIQSFIEFRKANKTGEVLVARMANLEGTVHTHSNQILELYALLEGSTLPKSGIFFNDQYRSFGI